MIRLFRVYIPSSVVGLVLSDLVLLYAFYLLGVWIVFPGDLDLYLLYDNGFVNISLVVGAIMLGLYFQNLYTDFRVKPMEVMHQMAFTVGMVLILEAMLAYIRPTLMMARWSMLIGSALTFMLIPAWRKVYTNVIYKGLGQQRVLFLGANPLVIAISENIATHPELGLIPLGFVADEHRQGALLASLPVLGGAQDLRAIAEEVRPDRIIVGMTERRGVLPVQQLLDLRFAGVRIEDAIATFEAAFGRVSIPTLRPSQLIFSSDLGPRPRALKLQTIYSFLIGCIALLPAAPIMLLVALGVKLTSRGPILYRQTRVGAKSVPFTVFKFRSMVSDAESGTGAVWAKRNDPRVTSFGKFMRRTRLDELPQLFNVLRGEMSIVGPRPERPEFVRVLSEQIPFYPQRHAVKPGITGWAQINYKYGDTMEDSIIKLEYDLYYIKNLSLALDMYIMFHTVKVMLFSQSGQ